MLKFVFLGAAVALYFITKGGSRESKGFGRLPV